VSEEMNGEDLKKIPFVLKSFRSEELEYDKTVGIQNFFRAVRRVVIKEDGEYEILKAIW